MTRLLCLSTREEWQKRQARHPQKSGAIGRRPYQWSEHLQIHLKAHREYELPRRRPVAAVKKLSTGIWRVPHYRIAQIPQPAINARLRTSADYQRIGVKSSSSLKEGFLDGAGNNSNRRLGPNSALQVGDALGGALPFLRLNFFPQVQLNGQIGKTVRCATSGISPLNTLYPPFGWR
jgi:hypothetical protein